MTEAPRRKKRLEVCPVCGGYMRETLAFGTGSGGHHWNDRSTRRAFGGHELVEFVCEKCHHKATFQIDDLVGIGEDR